MESPTKCQSACRCGILQAAAALGLGLTAERFDIVLSRKSARLHSLHTSATTRSTVYEHCFSNTKGVCIIRMICQDSCPPSCFRSILNVACTPTHQPHLDCNLQPNWRLARVRLLLAASFLPFYGYHIISYLSCIVWVTININIRYVQ